MGNDLEIWIKISQQMGELNSSIKSVLDRLLDHDQRLRALEQNKTDEGGMKNKIIELLVKCVLIGTTAVATLVGAGGIVSRILPDAPQAIQQQTNGGTQK